MMFVAEGDLTNDPHRPAISTANGDHALTAGAAEQAMATVPADPVSTVPSSTTSAE